MTADEQAGWPELPSESSVSFPGPFEHHEVVVEGRAVPFLQANLVDGGQIDLTLDKRFGLLLSVEEAERFVPFLAHAIAIALGYTAHPNAERDGPNERNPFPRVHSLALE